MDSDNIVTEPTGDLSIDMRHAMSGVREAMADYLQELYDYNKAKEGADPYSWNYYGYREEKRLEEAGDKFDAAFKNAVKMAVLEDRVQRECR